MLTNFSRHHMVLLGLRKLKQGLWYLYLDRKSYDASWHLEWCPLPPMGSQVLWHMSITPSQITRNSTVCTTVCSGVNQRRHQTLYYCPLWGESTWRPVDSLHKGPVTQKVFTCQDLIMEKKIWTFIFWWCVTEVQFYGFSILQRCHISLKASHFTGHSSVCSKTCLGSQHRKHQCLKLTVLWYKWRKWAV